MKVVGRFLLGGLGALMLVSASGVTRAADKKVVVAYQTDALPFVVAIANGDFAKSTGYDIDFRRFNSGADIFAAIASGDVQVGYVGSSPYAAAASRGLDVKAFYITSISGTDEALVVRSGSGINKLSDLKGKKLAAAPVSTDHYQLLALLKSLGLGEKDVQVLAIPQPSIVAAYKRGDIDGGFVWDPALTELKKTGKVLLTSRDVAKRGAPTFSAWVATGNFAHSNPEFLKVFARVSEKYAKSFESDKSAWNANSANAKSLASLLGGTPEAQASALKNLSLISPRLQSSSAWLAGGDHSGVARILKDTSVFLKEQGKISEVLPDYGKFVTAEAVKPLDK